ncbi:hypothetical protein ZWY2020_045138 [Hordeum vulgare]|nr:hypothetical protein ZWY2020_045138 [Hordeum vulgare]
MPIDVHEILKIKASPRLGEDFLAWGADRTGIFTVRSAYRLALEGKLRSSTAASSTTPDGRRAVWAFLWGCPAPPKVRVFAWRLATNSLATLSNKHEHHMEVTDICPLCGLEREDSFHTFCKCPRAVELWRAMARVWRIPQLEDVRNTGSEWALHLLASCDEGNRLRLSMLLWRCWFVRNEIVHDKPAPLIEASRNFLQSYVTSILGIQKFPMGDWDKGKMVIQDRAGQPAVPRRAATEANYKWVPPPESWTKLNVDGSYNPHDGTAGEGMVLRDHNGDIIFSACRSLWSCPDALHAELAGCMEGLALAHQWTQLPVILECDSLKAVHMIKNTSGNRS